MGEKDVVSKEILTNIARDISKHILHIEVKDDIELIRQEFSRVESRESDLLYKIRLQVCYNRYKKYSL